VSERSAPDRSGGPALLLALGLLSAFGPLCLDMYLPALPDLPAGLNSTAGAAQLSLTACLVGLGVGQLVTGPLSDRVGRRLPLLIGVAVFTVASALCALTPAMWLLIVLRFVQGAAGAAGIVVGRAVVADMLTGSAAAAYFSALAAINGLSPILAPLLGAQVLRIGDWRTIFWVLTGIGAALLALTAAAVPETLPKTRRTAPGRGALTRGLPIVLADRGYRGYVLAGVAVMAAMFGYISASPFLLQDGFGLSPQQFSLCFAANAIGIITATMVNRMLLRRYDPARLLRWGLLQGSIGALLVLLAVGLRWGLWPVLIALFVMVSAVGFASPDSSALAMDRHRRQAGAASAVYGSAQYATGTLATIVVGIGDRTVGIALGVTAVVFLGAGWWGFVDARR
jgi:DHA1 family bicyclomycin/chloramphenicol resistance-like MFS transporter